MQKLFESWREFIDPKSNEPDKSAEMHARTEIKKVIADFKSQYKLRRGGEGCAQAEAVVLGVSMKAQPNVSRSCKFVNLIRELYKKRKDPPVDLSAEKAAELYNAFVWPEILEALKTIARKIKFTYKISGDEHFEIGTRGVFINGDAPSPILLNKGFLVPSHNLFVGRNIKPGSRERVQAGFDFTALNTVVRHELVHYIDWIWANKVHDKIIGSTGAYLGATGVPAYGTRNVSSGALAGDPRSLSWQQMKKLMKLVDKSHLQLQFDSGHVLKKNEEVAYRNQVVENYGAAMEIFLKLRRNITRREIDLLCAISGTGAIAKPMLRNQPTVQKWEAELKKYGWNDELIYRNTFIGNLKKNCKEITDEDLEEFNTLTKLDLGKTPPTQRRPRPVTKRMAEGENKS